MKLIDIITKLDGIDDELIIYIQNKEDFASDILLAYGNENDNGIKIEEGKKYYYLLELFLAKEFVEDWLGTLKNIPSNLEIAKRLYEYSINDA
jgi:hypothetical protein